MTATTVRPLQTSHLRDAERSAKFDDPTFQAVWLLRMGFLATAFSHRGV